MRRIRQLTMPPGIRRALRLPPTRERLTRELEDEMCFHIEMRIAELVAGGMRLDDARGEALRRFGDPEELREYCHSIEVPHMRRMHAREWVEAWMHDFRFAGRQFKRTPGFVAVVVTTLALGIGATTAIFSVVNGVMLRALPYSDPDRIVQLWEVAAKGGRNQFADPNFADVRSMTRSFAALAEIAGPTTMSVTGGTEPVRAGVVVASHDFFAALGLRPAVGRFFLSDEQQPGARRTAVVGHRFWQRSLGGSASALGTVLRIGDESYTVVGVMPPNMRDPEDTDILIPRELEPPLPSRTAHNWQVIGRLAPGVTIEQAQREVSALAKRLKVELGDDTNMNDAAIVTLRDQLVGGLRPTLLLLLGASIILLCIACANVVNLLVARMAARQGEIALRLALGAARRRLVQQCLAESLMLAIAGGAVGVLLAVLCVRVLLLFQTGNLPRVQEARVDGGVLSFALIVSVLTAVALGLLAAWRGARGDLRAALAHSQRTLSGGSSERIRRTLVVAQMAMTFVLLVGATLLGRSFVRLLQVDPGFRTENAVVLDVSLPASGGAAMRERVRVYDELLDRLGRIPGVRAAGGVNAMPLTADAASNGTFLVMRTPDERIADFERAARDPERTGQAEFRIVSAGYFSAMNVPLLRGRTFDSRDGPDAPHVALVSAALATAKWPNEDPIGKIIQFGNMDGDLRPFTVIGIVGDLRQWSLALTPRPTFYAFVRQRPVAAGRLNIVMATVGDRTPVIAAAQRVVRDLRPDIPARLRTIETIVAESVADRRFVLFVVGVFGGSALLLATLGVYSVISYLVAQRSREISIRVALGAQKHEVIRLVLRQGALVALVGIAAGAAASLGLTRLLGTLLYEVSPTDPAAFVMMVALLTLVALLASWLPARRAARVDVMDILRGG